MSEEELAELDRLLCSNHTPLPWNVKLEDADGVPTDRHVVGPYHPQLDGPAPVIDLWVGIPVEPGGRTFGISLSLEDAALLVASVNNLPRLLAEVRELRGAMAAQDERERVAGERCGVSAEEHGCDWPEWVADEVLALRARLAQAEEDLAHVHEFRSHSDSVLVAILAKGNQQRWNVTHWPDFITSIPKTEWFDAQADALARVRALAKGDADA